MKRDVKGEARIRPAKKPGKENEMSCTGYREKLSQALYCAEDDGLKDIHRLTCTVGTVWRSSEKSSQVSKRFRLSPRSCERPPLLTRRGITPDSGFSTAHKIARTAKSPGLPAK